MKIVDWPEQTWNAGIDRGPPATPAIRSLLAARERYNEVLGGRLAAAIAYYALLRRLRARACSPTRSSASCSRPTQSAVDAVNRFLAANIPFLDASQIADSRNTVAIVGLIGLVFTGVGWIESLRSSQRGDLGLDQQPGNVFIRRLVDLAILVGARLCCWRCRCGSRAASTTGSVRSCCGWRRRTCSVGCRQAILTIGDRGRLILLALLVNCVLAASMLSGVARLRMPLRRLLPSTLLVAVGLTLLSTVGRAYIELSSHRPAYQVVGGTVGLLLFLYLFNQLLLYGAALAATSTPRHGRRPGRRARRRAEDQTKINQVSTGIRSRRHSPRRWRR